MQSKELIEKLERLAPPEYAESWDNPGLLGIFLDYFESLGEDFLYTGTESEKIVKDLIATL